MLQIIAGSWPIAVMFIATLGALLALKVMRIAERNRKEDIAYRASQALTVRESSHVILIALCATSLLLHAGGAIAADLPVGTMMIGGSPMGGGSAPVRRPSARQRLIAECKRDVPVHETQKQFERRLNLPCPGRRE